MEITVDVGIVIVDQDGHLLAARRLPIAKSGNLVLPGGKPKYGESITDCVKRETLKETGLQVEVLDLHLLGPIFHATERVEKGRHVYTAFVAAKMVGGALACVGPDNGEPWKWYTIGRATYESNNADLVPLSALLRYRRELGL